jgi:hypothetical protein
MMNGLRRNDGIGLIAALILATLYACQPPPPTPIPASAPPPPAPVAEAPPIAPEVEIAKTPAASAPTPPQSPKPKIHRSLPESVISAPERDPVPRQLAYNTKIGSRSADTANGAAWHYRRNNSGEIVGFEFSNHGGNPILPPRRDAPKNQFYSRDFQFRFDDRARQDIFLMVTDWAPSRDRQFRLSELMNSLMHFFPRRFLPAIVSFDGRTIVTLPTGEEVEFNTQTHEIAGGVLAEAPVDLNPDRGARKFPALVYNGKGVVVRANARGADPRIGTTATITSGSPPPDCGKSPACQQCQVPARDLWDQTGAVRFKFATDEEFDRFLLTRCQFGLPKIENGSTLAAPSK